MKIYQIHTRNIKCAKYLGRKPAKLQQAIKSIFMALVKCQAIVSLLDDLSVKRKKTYIHRYIKGI